MASKCTKLARNVEKTQSMCSQLFMYWPLRRPTAWVRYAVKRFYTAFTGLLPSFRFHMADTSLSEIF